MKSFAAIAAAAAPGPSSDVGGAASGHPIPTGSWSVYYHEPEDTSWTGDSYKRLHDVDQWETMEAVFRELGPHKTENGLLRIMRGDTSPLWENRVNIHGGSYCLKISRRNAIDVFRTYWVAAALGLAATDPENRIVGVTISPKKGFCIIKIWNLDCRRFSAPTDLPLLHSEVRHEEILYRAHTEQRM